MNACFCDFCSRPCGPLGFCDDVCRQEYEDELACQLDGYKDELPVGEPKYQSYYEPEEWLGASPL